MDMLVELITTSSFVPGSDPVLQLVAVFQSPLPPIQETVAALVETQAATARSAQQTFAESGLPRLRTAPSFRPEMNHKTPFQVADAVIQLDFEYLTIHIAAVMRMLGTRVRFMVSPAHKAQAVRTAWINAKRAARRHGDRRGVRQLTRRLQPMFGSRPFSRRLEPETGIVSVVAASSSLNVKAITTSIRPASKFRLPGLAKDGRALQVLFGTLQLHNTSSGDTEGRAPTPLPPAGLLPQGALKICGVSAFLLA